jgi:uncharacterized protein
MVALPEEDRWEVRRLAGSDRQRVVRFLTREEALNAFLISRIEDEGLSGLTPYLEVAHRRETLCIAAVGTNVVFGVAPDLDEEIRRSLFRVLGEQIVRNFLPVRAIIAEAAGVELLWKQLAPQVTPPTVIRMNQPVYLLTGGARLLPDLNLVRYATIDDLDALVPACAAMHREEVGIDPLERDALGYRFRIRELITRQRSLVLTIEGSIGFKCEFSAVTAGTIQLMGVWTSPRFRRQGLARQGLAEVCGHILRGGRSVTLFVNDFNTPAMALYESLGFRRIGCNRALIW